MTSESAHFCAWHPKVEANVRCSGCDQYVCVDCMIDAPVGFKCPACARGTQPERFSAAPASLAVCAATSAATAYAGGLALSFLPLGFLLIAAAHYLLGMLAGEAGQRAARKSGRKIKIAVGAGTAAGLIALNFKTVLLGAFLNVPAFHILIAVACIGAAVLGGMGRVAS